MRNKTSISQVLLPLVLIVLSSVAPLQAQILVQYNFTTNADPSTVAANTTASPTTISYPLGGVSGSGRSGDGNLFARGASSSSGGLIFQNSLANAITANDYFQFSLTPDSGYSVNLTSLTVDWGGQAGSLNSFTFNYGLTSSVDGHTASDVIGIGSRAVSGTPATFGPQSLSLSAAKFQGLSAPVTFRLYFYATDIVGTDSWNKIGRVDNITLNGAVIPEPSTYALFGIGLGALMILRRRRKLSSAGGR